MGFLSFLTNITRVLCGGPPFVPENEIPPPVPEKGPVYVPYRRPTNRKQRSPTGPPPPPPRPLQQQKPTQQQRSPPPPPPPPTSRSLRKQQPPLQHSYTPAQTSAHQHKPPPQSAHQYSPTQQTHVPTEQPAYGWEEKQRLRDPPLPSPSRPLRLEISPPQQHSYPPARYPAVYAADQENPSKQTHIQTEQPVYEWEEKQRPHDERHKRHESEGVESYGIGAALRMQDLSPSPEPMIGRSDAGAGAFWRELSRSPEPLSGGRREHSDAGIGAFWLDPTPSPEPVSVGRRGRSAAGTAVVMHGLSPSPEPLSVVGRGRSSAAAGVARYEISTSPEPLSVSGRGRSGTGAGVVRHELSLSPEPVSPRERGQPRGKFVDHNQINHQNPYYASLRALANEQGDAMVRCFEESHQVFTAGDRARAKQLSNEGKKHKAEMERLHSDASAWIFKENNLDSRPGEIDLHGLYVKEAIAFTEKYIQEARQRGDSTIRLIVGKGIHAKNEPKLKPAIEKLMLKQNLVAIVDSDNSGVLVVRLDGDRAPANKLLEILWA